MPLFFTYQSNRPNRIADEKNEDYHLKFARWSLTSMNHPVWRRFITKSLINWSFYKGGDGQWIYDEDLEAFFLDESGDVRNRLKISKNLIRPMVEQYVGNAVRLAYDAGATSTSDFIINRREKELARLKFFEDVEQALPEFNNAIRNNIPLGETPMQTEEIFENAWQDDFEDQINYLLQYIEKDVDIETLKVIITKHLAITGLGIYKGHEQNLRYIGTYTDPIFFFFDLSAKRPDLSDAEYMGEWYYMDVPSILERWQNLTDKQRRTIERYSINESIDIHRLINNYYSVGGAKIPVYESYWKDIEVQEYGWVEDPYGYPYFALINHEDSEFTDKDLIEPPDNAHEKMVDKGKKKTKVYVDVLRYCIFIPKEEVGVENAGEGDIVLEYGEVPYQEKYKMSPSSVEFPYKCHTWSYDKGEILSPLDDAINPQRFINRLLSVAESHINNARGAGTVIAKDAVDPRDGEETIHRNVNKSKTIFVDTTRTGSVQNSVGTYGTSIGQGTMNLFNIINEMQVSLQDITGINEAMTGTQGGSDALVGVIQSQIQRGSLVQEPFYWALTSILKGAYQQMASMGKRIYAENPRRLAIMVGDKGMQQIMLTKDMLMEDFRVFIERKESEPAERANADALLFTLVQAGLIDQMRFANLYGRANARLVAKAVREYAQERRMVEQQQGDAQMQQAQAEEQTMIDAQATADARDMQLRQDDADERERDRQLDLDKTLIKEGAKNEREEMKYSANNQ